MKNLSKKDIIISSVSLALGIIVTLTLVLLISVKPLKKDNKNVKSELEALNNKYSTAQSQLESVNQTLDNTTSENNSLKTNISSKDDEIEKSKSEIEANKQALEKSKKELSDNKAQLDKAKEGIKKLKDLDSLFTKYDNESEELINILDGYSVALQNGDQGSANTYEQQYVTKSDSINNTYDSIKKILEEFRNGKY